MRHRAAALDSRTRRGHPAAPPLAAAFPRSGKALAPHAGEVAAGPSPRPTLARCPEHRYRYRECAVVPAGPVSSLPLGARCRGPATRRPELGQLAPPRGRPPVAPRPEGTCGTASFAERTLVPPPRRYSHCRKGSPPASLSRSSTFRHGRGARAGRVIPPSQQIAEKDKLSTQRRSVEDVEGSNAACKRPLRCLPGANTLSRWEPRPASKCVEGRPRQSSRRPSALPNV